MAPRYLLDTCVLVHLVRGDIDGKRIQRDFNLKAFYGECMISVVTWGEMEKLGREFGWDNKKLKVMRDLLEQLITIDIKKDEPEIISAYADIDHASSQRGIHMGKNDVWIAATARATGYELLTMDKDFDHLSELIQLRYIAPSVLYSHSRRFRGRPLVSAEILGGEGGGFGDALGKGFGAFGLGLRGSSSGEWLGIPFNITMIYRRLLRPILFQLDEETAHNVSLRAAHLLTQWPMFAHALHSLAAPKPRPVSALGLTFPNPVGLAAGMDKNGVAPLAWWAFGFGFVELGTVTPVRQKGNDPRRMFRYPAEEALVNRMGFNNGGAPAFAARMEQQREARLRPPFPIGISVGKNKDIPAAEAPDDFARAADLVASHADFLTVNVSSPNTPGLRSLQDAQELAKIVRAVKRVSLGKPVLVKFAPEMEPIDLYPSLDACLAEGAAGFIATNTLSTRDKPQYETGGLSGRPLREIAPRKVAQIRQHIGDGPTVIGCGGIHDATSAQTMLNAGANLVQIYTALVYQGPFLPATITQDLRS
ncbi:MAG: quinone-dependent dihydroorotate dehydrogenase [Fimbriiglobus sp.]